MFSLLLRQQGSPLIGVHVTQSHVLTILAGRVLTCACGGTETPSEEFQDHLPLLDACPQVLQFAQT
ncbi:hypothetical protein GCM10009702_08000 [Propioniferax innocua]